LTATLKAAEVVNHSPNPHGEGVQQRYSAVAACRRPPPRWGGIYRISAAVLQFALGRFWSRSGLQRRFTSVARTWCVWRFSVWIAGLRRDMRAAIRWRTSSSDVRRWAVRSQAWLKAHGLDDGRAACRFEW